MLTSPARETLRGVEAVIIDEIHALAATKRGAHLALTLERLDAVADAAAAAHRPVGHAAPARRDRPLPRRPRRRSGAAPPGHDRRRRHAQAARRSRSSSRSTTWATCGEVARGRRRPAPRPRGAGARSRSGRPCTPACSSWCSSTAPRSSSSTPAAWPSAWPPGSTSWPPRASTAAPRPTARRRPWPTELVQGPPRLARRERRLVDRGRAQVRAAARAWSPRRRSSSASTWAPSTSSSRSSRRARSPRACSASAGPATRWASPAGASSSPSTAPTCSRRRWSCRACRQGLIEHTRYPRNPLDVLAQQIVAMVALDDWTVDELAAPGAPRPRTSPSSPTRCSPRCSTCWPAATRPTSSPSCAPASCGTASTARVRGRAGAQRLAVTSGGTIPDRGLFGVFLPDGTRVGELDEEMVYESRPGETFLLGAVHLAHRGDHPRPGDRHAGAGPAGQDAVLARRRPGPPARARPGPRRVRARRCARCRPTTAHGPPARRRTASTSWPPRNLLRYLDEQAEATGAVPDDRTIVVERFRDEIGDWRVCVLIAVRRAGPRAVGHGAAGPAGRAAGASTSSCMWSDDGIVMRLPEAVDELPARRAARSTPTRSTSSSSRSCRPRAMFAARFRECAARALLLPRRRPDQRTPLWQQRQRAADLLAVAAGYPDFPILLETTRECLQRRLRPAGAARGAARPAQPQGPARRRSTRPGRRRSRSRCCSAGSPSTCTRATRRWPSAGPPRSPSTATCCASCSAPRSCASCSTRRCSPSSSSSCSACADGRRARDADEVHDLLRVLGPLTVDEVDGRAPTARRAATWLDELARRAAALIEVAVAGEARVRRRRGRGPAPRRASAVAVPLGLPDGLHRPGRRARSPTSSPATPAPTGPFLTARGRRPPRRRPAPRRSGVLDRARGRRPRRARRVPARTASSASGATTTCCASCGGGRWPRCAARSSRSTPRPSPASCPRGRASACRAAASTAWSRSLGLLQGAAMPGVGARGRRAAGPGRAATGRPTSTRCAPRARWCGSGAGRARHRRRPGAPALPRPGRAAGARARRRRGREVARPTPSPTDRRPCTRAPRPTGAASFWPDLVAAAPRPGWPTTTRRCSARCGTWCGRARSPTTPSPRCAATLHRAGRRSRPRRTWRRRGPAPGACTPHRPARGRRALVARGHRCSHRCEAPAPTPTEAAHALALQLLERTACSPARRCWPRASRAGSPACTRCSRRSRSAARCGAATSWPASAPRSSPCPAPSTGSGRVRDDAEPPTARAAGGAGRHRPGPALRRGAAWPEATGAGHPARAAGAAWCCRAVARWPTSSGAAAAWSRSPAAASPSRSPTAAAGVGDRARRSVRRQRPLARARHVDGRAGPRVAPRRPTCGPPASSTATGAWCSAPPWTVSDRAPLTWKA